MSIKLTQTESIQTYFCTFTCKNWLHLFEITNLYNDIYKWFNILVNKGSEIEAFVIMPNHLHLLIFVNAAENINMLLANGKRFLAYEIVKRLEKFQQYEILQQLELAVTAKERQRKKKHRIFEVSSDIKPCYTEKFLLQKLDYIHNNPCTDKWKLVNLPEEYIHSSAGFYLLNKQHPFVKVIHWKDVAEHSTHRPLAGDDAGHRKPCYTEKFLLQKLDYIHNNPCTDKWKLVNLPEEYIHSSAGFYMLNKQHPFVKVIYWKDVAEHSTHRPLAGDDAGR